MVSQVLPDLKSFYRALLLALLFYFVFKGIVRDSFLTSFKFFLTFVLYTFISYCSIFKDRSLPLFCGGNIILSLFFGFVKSFSKKILFFLFFSLFFRLFLPSLRDSPNIILLFFAFVNTFRDFLYFFLFFYSLPFFPFFSAALSAPPLPYVKKKTRSEL